MHTAKPHVRINILHHLLVQSGGAYSNSAIVLYNAFVALCVGVSKAPTVL